MQELISLGKFIVLFMLFGLTIVGVVLQVSTWRDRKKDAKESERIKQRDTP
ncbi:MAG TPA: hypothetical protein VI937_03700 [Negativicutes bacterium]|nr:hypothetical protein [Negativicutes bacterium]